MYSYSFGHREFSGDRSNMIQYLIYNATLVLIYVMVSLSFALPVGFTGLVNLGQVGLFAIGAYASAILTTHGISFWIALPLSALITMLVGLLLALPARRVKSDYYALLSLGFLFVVNSILIGWINLTRGPFGISGIDRPAFFQTPVSFLLLTFAVTVIIGLFVYRLIRSPFGKALEAVRDDDQVAESLGKPVGKLRVLSIFISAFIVGIAGAFLAHFIRFINPQLFWLDNVIWILAALVLGGLASFRGAIFGMVFLFIATEAIRFFPFSSDVLGALRLISLSLLLLGFVLFKPKGLFGRAQLE